MTTVKLASRHELETVAPADRVLLLPHCLRPSETCPGKYSKQGLMCPDDCFIPCSIGVLQEAALKEGYKGVCTAPGGSMVLRFVERMAPQAIVAVACQKELELGVKGVKELTRSGKVSMPVITVVPLSKEGCVDTEVDVAEVIEIITS